LILNKLSRLYIQMARLIIFPDQDAFDQASIRALLYGASIGTVRPPEFCRGMAAPALLVRGGITSFEHDLDLLDIPVSGVIEYSPSNRVCRDAPPLDSRWREITGRIRLRRVGPSLTDPHRLSVEAITEKSLDLVIPYVARLIRGGAYRPDVPVIAFEEQHRLIIIAPREVTISRVDDLWDLWRLIRTTVELLCAAWDRRSVMEPEQEPRQGVGATEIFKLLPSTNCGQCHKAGCMEFAAGLLTGKCTIEQCAPLFHGKDPRYIQSLNRLLRAVGG
jgi:ArsR family metal-binding transcriptional regulator